MNVPLSQGTIYVVLSGCDAIPQNVNWHGEKEDIHSYMAGYCFCCVSFLSSTSDCSHTC